MKSDADKMGIPRNGCKTSKSLSPEMMQEAWLVTASSRNLSSLVSREGAMDSVTIINKRTLEIKEQFPGGLSGSVFGFKTNFVETLSD